MGPLRKPPDHGRPLRLMGYPKTDKDGGQHFPRTAPQTHETRDKVAHPPWRRAGSRGAEPKFGLRLRRAAQDGYQCDQLHRPCPCRNGQDARVQSEKAKNRCIHLTRPAPLVAKYHTHEKIASVQYISFWMLCSFGVAIQRAEDGRFGQRLGRTCQYPTNARPYIQDHNAI